VGFIAKRRRWRPGGRCNHGATGSEHDDEALDTSRERTAALRHPEVPAEDGGAQDLLRGADPGVPNCPELLLSAGLQALAAVVGHRAAFPPASKPRPLNTLQIVVGDARTGEYGRDMKHILCDLLPEDTWAMEGPFQYGKLLSKLQKHPNVVFLPWDLVLELRPWTRRYAWHALLHCPPEYKTTTSTDSRDWTVHEPFASMLAVQDPAPFLYAMTDSYAETEMIARCLTLFVRAYKGPEPEPPDPTDLGSRVQRIREALLALRQDLSARVERDGRLVMAYSDGGRAVLEHAGADYCERRDKANPRWDPAFRCAVGAYQHIHRAAGLMQLSIDGRPDVGGEATEAAAHLAWHAMDGAQALFGQGRPEIVEARCTRVHEILAQRRDGSVSRSELLRKAHVTADQLDQEIARLHGQGVLGRLNVEITGDARTGRRRGRQ